MKLSLFINNEQHKYFNIKSQINTTKADIVDLLSLSTANPNPISAPCLLSKA
jgi:hypothetical protein